MRKRDLFNLPTGRDFEFTDGHFHYNMKKVICEDNSIMQVWQQKGFPQNRFVIFEETEFNKEEKFLEKKLIVHIWSSGFSAMSELSSFQLGRLKLINNNSLKNWLLKFNY